MIFHNVHVSTYSGYKADERPLRFAFKEKTHTIREIINQTYEEISGKGLRKRYTIKTDEGLTFKLFYEENQDRWFLEE
ncbi:MAG: hypothetical protein HYV59_05725 [Planctomycetes bacterium]|nr:hypothetical protein [Planctomycetota bacterium]